jgi:Uma2 family endonuclease
MATNPHGVLLTYEDYAAIPSDRNRHEILNGVLSVTPAPSTFHQDAVTNLTRLLSDYVRRQGLGKILVAPCDVLLSTHNIVQPDILFVARERLHIVEPANVKGAPDLVIEVLSPSTAVNDLNVKRQVYAEHGVQHYWIVDPNRRSITAHTLVGDVYEPSRESSPNEPFSAPPFSALAIDLAEVWE